MTIASLPLRLLLLVVAVLAVGVAGMQVLTGSDEPLADRLTSRAAAAFGMGGSDPTLSVTAAPSVSVAPGGATGRISEAAPLH